MALGQPNAASVAAAAASAAAAAAQVSRNAIAAERTVAERENKQDSKKMADVEPLRPNAAAAAAKADKVNYGACLPINSSRVVECPTAAADDAPTQPRGAWLERASKRVPCLGVLMALCASLFLGTAGMLVKLTHSVHGIQVAVLRACIQLLIYALVIRVRRLRVLPPRAELGQVAARALFGATSITLSYYALKLIPLGDATTIRFSLPIWTLIISYFFLGEPCNLLKVGSVLVAVCGVVLIAKPDDCVYYAHSFLRSLSFESETEFAKHDVEHEQARAEQVESLLEVAAAPLPAGGVIAHLDPVQQLEGCSMALASSICLSLSLIALRLCKQTAAEVTILWLSLASILTGTVTLVALNEWRLPNNWLDGFYILLNGLCGAIGQWFITSALKIEQSGVIALARTFDIQVAFLYSALLLREHIRATSVCGSLLISCGVLTVVLPKWFGQRGAARPRAAAAASEPVAPQDSQTNQAGDREKKSALFGAAAGTVAAAADKRPGE